MRNLALALAAGLLTAASCDQSTTSSPAPSAPADLSAPTPVRFGTNPAPPPATPQPTTVGPKGQVASAPDTAPTDFSTDAGAALKLAKAKAAADQTAAPAAVPAPAPNGATKRLILIGDSHTAGTFGHALDGLLRKSVPAVETYGSCGASPSWYVPGNPVSGHTSPCGTWFHRYSAADPSKLEEVTRASPTPLIGALLKEKPDVVVVALGTNMIDWSKGGISGLDSAAALGSAIKGAGARCLWIGPPDGLGSLSRAAATASLAKLNSSLASTLSGTCAYLPSQTTYQASWPDPEKLHYPADAASAWATQADQHVEAALGGR
jgi:hypothetical protein